MPDPNPAALDFLRTRRSRPAKTLVAPIPGREEIHALLTIAGRTPDHGKLEPWRFVVIGPEAQARMAGLVDAHGAELGKDENDITKCKADFERGLAIVAVIASPVESPKIPELEQVLSAGAVCLALLNGALAAGWGANWLSGWASHDQGFCRQALNLEGKEFVAGMIHIGTETTAPPDRPRPDIDAKTIWLDA